MHLHPFIWKKLDNYFVFILKYNILHVPFIVIGIALIGLTIMLMIDIIRSKIFKLLRIENLCTKLDNLINKINCIFIDKLPF